VPLIVSRRVTLTQGRSAGLGKGTANVAPTDHQHGRLHGPGAEPIQGVLAGVNRLQIFALQSVIAAVHYRGGWGFLRSCD
jgi:hypothetical protein